MSTPKELLAQMDAALSEVYRAINELRKISVENEDLLDIHRDLDLRERMASDIQSHIRGLAFTIGAERHHRWATSERFYVYVSERYGDPVEPSLTGLGEVSGSSWHDLHFAARHWRHMEEISLKPNPHRKGKPSRYSIMAYDPSTGRIRKVGQSDIDAVLAEKR